MSIRSIYGVMTRVAPRFTFTMFVWIRRYARATRSVRSVLSLSRRVAADARRLDASRAYALCSAARVARRAMLRYCIRRFAHVTVSSPVRPLMPAARLMPLLMLSRHAAIDVYHAAPRDALPMSPCAATP